MHIARFCLLLSALLLSPALLGPPVHAQALDARTALPPRPRLVAPPEARLPIQITRMTVQADAVGLQMQTRIELTLMNPNARALEATLEFPLGETQSISGFALDVDGVLMPAVPVAKDKGRQVFDDVTRARVDPALLERTAGNAFRLRVYPLPAAGTRRVVLHLSEVLRPGEHGRVAWRLPVDFGQRVGELSVDIAASGATALQAPDALPGATAGRRGTRATLHLQRSDWQPREPLTVQWQAPADESVRVASHDGRTYFYAELPVDGRAGPPRLPREVGIVWDASGSGAQRDHAREFALLDALFAASRTVRVQLVLARDVAEPVVTFDVRNGDWRALRSVLQRVAYDGASNAAAWQPPAMAADGLALLFTDGLANWQAPSASPVPAGADNKAPLYTLNAAARSDSARLRRLAEASGGRALDLNSLTTAQALQALLRSGLRLVDVQASGAEQIRPASVHPEGGRLALAGVMTAARARLTLTLIDAQGRRQTRHIDIDGSGADTAADADTVALPAQRWAQLAVAELEGERQRHRAEIRRLGEQFRLVTAETSLIVLERLADYLRYEIVPPAGAMRRDYLEQLARRDGVRAQSRTTHLDALVRRFDERQRWWARDFPKDAPPRPAPDKLRAQELARDESANRSRMSVGETEQRSARMAGTAQAFAPAAAPPPPAAAPAGNAAADSSAAAGPAARIALQRWEPDAPYARRLRNASDADRYAIYLDERGSHASSTAFFIDAADIFFAKKQPALALRVLSNLAEMELENRQILRILAYRLQQADLQALAIPLLERVAEIAPDEPQSGRDLGLALAADGQHQRALDTLWDVASRAWDNRFADIDIIALGELNAIAARVPGLDTTRVDPRLLRNLSLDLRAVLSWDADNTDIDLWVTDPNGEKTYYGHRLSYQGGAMTRDFTGGYGPEEFSLRVAKPGRYEVRAQFYGHQQQIISPHTTLMLWLSTGFGTAAQKDERVVLRLSGQKEQVLVGTFEVAPRP